MTKLFPFLILTIMSFSFNYSNPEKSSIYDIKISTLEGETIDMNAFKGKKLLIVNVASECGFTKQYAELQDMYEHYGDKLMIMGVPCNQFGKQEPGSPQEIADFCQKNFGVTFLLTEKVEVKGDNQHPLYAWLTQEALNGVEDSKVKWNFHKYLIDENGNLIGSFGSATNPLSEDIIDKL